MIDGGLADINSLPGATVTIPQPIVDAMDLFSVDFEVEMFEDLADFQATYGKTTEFPFICISTRV